MKVTIVSAWYNEELIAPYFLKHYSDMVDDIYIILDTDTNDGTINILQQNDKVHVIPFTYPNGFDDHVKVEMMRRVYNTIQDGWICVVDSDEFISISQDIKSDIISTAGGDYNVINAELWHPYRNINDDDLNPLLPPIQQRRYGVKYNKHGNQTHYIKPCIVKSGLNIRWSAGQHLIYGNYMIYSDSIKGVHWQYADPSIVLERHTRNRINRNGPDNIRMGCSTHFKDFTEQNVLEECNKHLNDGRLF